MKNASEVRSDLNMGILFISVETGEPEVAESAPAVVWSLTDGTDNLSEMCGVQLYESGIDSIVQRTSIALGNFNHSWVSVLTYHSDLDFASVILFIKTMRNPQNV